VHSKLHTVLAILLAASFGRHASLTRLHTLASAV
jgi:hypothetical protein